MSILFQQIADVIEDTYSEAEVVTVLRGLMVHINSNDYKIRPFIRSGEVHLTITDMNTEEKHHNLTWKQAQEFIDAQEKEDSNLFLDAS